MATDHSDKLNGQLYRALTKKDKGKVLSLCKQLPEEDKGPMHVVTIHKDSVLHVALYSMQVDLVDELLNMLSKNPKSIMHVNTVGNTVLHEAATYDKFHSVARSMLQLQPQLLTATNNNRETPLFSAARYGQLKVFKLLVDELNRTFGNEVAKKFHMKDDGSTILHAAIAAEHYEMAICIAKKYEYLCDQKDVEKLTALQLLACNPLPFKFRGKGWLKTFIDYRIKNSDEDEDSSSLQHEEIVKSGYSVPWWDKMVEKRKTYNAVVKLAKLLIEKDTSWKATEYVGTTYAKKSEDKEDDQNSELKKIEAVVKKIEAQMKKTDQDEMKKIKAEKIKAERQQTPLLLATQTGCFEIVDEILSLHPQAVEQVDEGRRCILHIAIKYRQMEIFNMVLKTLEVPMRRLIRKCDAKGNSILHMVGKKIRNEDVEQTAERSPFFQLQADLLLFKRIKKVITPHFHKHTNHDGKTAEELLALNKEVLREKSQEWLKRTAENCSIVAVLIATVAFAAAYTVPGGSNPNNGSPVLLNQTFFVIFTIGDVLSLTFCLTTVVIFLSILTSSFQLREFKHALPQKLMLGITCLILSVTMMMLAFAATIILMIRNNEQWTRIALYTVAFLPVTVFAGVYMPLYLSLMGTFKHTLIKIGSYFPRSKGTFKHTLIKIGSYFSRSKGTFKHTLIKIGSYFPRSNCKTIDQSLGEQNKIEVEVLVVNSTASPPTAKNSHSLV